nr:hypothetical protein [Tanacetum cinerariifolium]
YGAVPEQLGAVVGTFFEHRAHAGHGRDQSGASGVGRLRRVPAADVQRHRRWPCAQPSCGAGDFPQPGRAPQPDGFGHYGQCETGCCTA